jgi:uncharacterized damage-inducible protein DinB
MARLDHDGGPDAAGSTHWKGDLFMVDDIEDPRRREPPGEAPEREMLEEWLEFHRTTLLLKCEGVDDVGLKQRPVATSNLSLHGLVRHMAEVERSWFQRVLQGNGAPFIWVDPHVEDSEFVPLDVEVWRVDIAAWQAECERSRGAAAEHGLDDRGNRRGKPYSLRWIYLHMIEEYARHNGHADLIRELVDGEVGC